jgi:hypothetical protein
MRRPTRNEAGATAVLFALLATSLLGVGAVAVDMGQVYAKRSALQSNVDMAVMAAAAELDNAGPCNPEVIAKAEEYLAKTTNKVADQISVNLSTGTAGNDADGSIQCNNWRVDLWAPRVEVHFGLAKALSPGNTGVEVPATAAAQIKSPSQSSSLPMYAVSGCDTGYQQLTDPPPGPAPAPVVPDLTPDGPPYNTVSNLAITTPNPAEIPAGSVTPVPMEVKGKNLVGTTAEVWFTNAAGDHVQAAGPLGITTSGPNFTITVPTVPQTVLDTNGIWYVRVFNDGMWSSESDAQALVIGDLLFCNGMVSGNFGTLKLARSDGAPATWLEMNIIKGMEPLLQINASSAVPCSPVDSDHAPTSPTDCVSTDPGFPNEAATDGLVNGSGSNPGRLDQDTTPGCDRTGGSNRTMTAPALNDDVLACYIVGAHNVGDVIAGEPGILSADIFKSPRFFQIPVIPVQASHGASGAYPLIGFRPGFITEEPSSSTRTARGSVTGHNGVHFHAGHVEQLNVVLFPDAALPETAPPVGGEIDYIGSGTKVLVLVN